MTDTANAVKHANSGEFDKKDGSTTAQTGVCGENQMRWSAQTAAKFSEYLTRQAPPVPRLSWKDSLIKCDAVIPLSVRPDSVDYAHRVRRRVIRFTAVARASRPSELSVTIHPDDCKRIFFADRCPSACRHVFVPLAIELQAYTIDSSEPFTFQIQLRTKWPNFTASSAATKLRPKAWLSIETWEAVRDTEDKDARHAVTVARGPQIGLNGAACTYTKAQSLFTADPRFALPVNFDTLGLVHSAQNDTKSQSLTRYGANPIAGRADAVTLKQPDAHTGIAPSILSLRYTSGFAARHGGGASQQTIDEQSFDRNGTKVNKKRNYWVCTPHMLHSMIAEIEAQQSKECLAMDVSDGITLTLYPDDQRAWTASTGRCCVSVTLAVTGVVV